MNLQEVIYKRQSHRDYYPDSLDKETLNPLKNSYQIQNHYIQTLKQLH